MNLSHPFPLLHHVANFGQFRPVLSLFCFSLAISILSACANNPTPTGSSPTPLVAGITPTPKEPYAGGYGPTEAPRFTPNQANDLMGNQLAESIAVPFLSFLIIEPDPVVKNGIPTAIEKLIKEKKYAEAITAIDEALKKSPRNVQLRFVKTRLQLELKQVEPARQTLIEITQQFPELPEPYNNLAALAANEKKWIEARDYLELAIKLRPDYATARGNLAAVYLQLSLNNYESAAKIQPNVREYGTRAKAINEIINPLPAKAKTPSTTPNPTPPKP